MQKYEQPDYWFREILDATPDAIVMVNGEGEIILVNTQAEILFGHQRGDLFGQKLDMLLPKRYRKKHSQYLQQYNENPYSRPMGANLELYGLHKDGSEFPVEISLSPLVSEEGLVIISAVRDVTERKKTEEELKQTTENLAHSNADLQKFAYVASHDLQEPLRGISGCLQILEKRYSDKLDDHARELISHAVNGATHLQNLIQDLLLFSRVESRGKKFDCVDVTNTVKFAIRNLKSAIEQNHAVITWDALPVVYADETQIISLFQNLFSNAIRYRSKEDPEIHISATKKDNNHWCFTVKDNGIGIDDAHHQRIFEIFQRLHGRHEYPGTGIGLAICKRIVERHGGHIWVVSKFGQGSRFQFTLSSSTSNAKAA